MRGARNQHAVLKEKLQIWCGLADLFIGKRTPAKRLDFSALRVFNIESVDKP